MNKEVYDDCLAGASFEDMLSSITPEDKKKTMDSFFQEIVSVQPITNNNLINNLVKQLEKE